MYYPRMSGGCRWGEYGFFPAKGPARGVRFECPRDVAVKGEFNVDDANRHNIFLFILKNGSDEGFVPQVTDRFCPTDAAPGSRAKVEVLAQRLRDGFPLWHPEDRTTYSGLTGSTAPREQQEEDGEKK